MIVISLSNSSIHITNQQSIAISVIRVLAMLLIIACHIAQAYEYQTAFLLNVGVQIFFLTSGFLYGKIEIARPIEFYRKRLTRIYIPYAFVVATVLIIQSLLGMWQFNFRDVAIYALNLQGFVSTSVAGLNHLWFLSVLMICYLLVPWLQRLLNNKPWLLVGGVIAASLLEFLLIQKMYSTCAWIVLFTSGMVYGKYESSKASLFVIAGSAVLLAGMSPFFRLDYLTDPNWAHYCVWFHCVLAVFIFAAIYYLLPKVISVQAELPILKQADKISYEVYLVHHPLILGPLALLTITSFTGLNIAIVLLTTVALAYVCMYVCMWAEEINELNYDTEDYSLLLVWRQANAGVGAQMYRELEEISSGVRIEAVE